MNEFTSYNGANNNTNITNSNNVMSVKASDEEAKGKILYMFGTETDNTDNSITTKGNETSKRNVYRGKVQPIQDRETIERAKVYFHDNPTRYANLHMRNYCLFVLGINFGRRISDLIQLRISEVIDNNGNVKESIIFHEGKTSKIAEVFINESAKEAIIEYLNYLEDYSLNDYLFTSRKGGHIQRGQAWNIMDTMGEELELNYHIGTHGMRKSFGTHILEDNKNDNSVLASLSELYNHSSEKMTRNYIGITRQKNKSLYMNLNL